MNNGSNRTAIAVLRAFLETPLHRKSFDPFFKLCLTETVSYLRKLRSSGWQIPTELVQNEQPFFDLAHDILGAFLASKPGQPFYVIFDYFRRHNLQNYSEIDDTILMKHFRILIRGFTRKEITLLRGLQNPQIHNLKHRCREILGGAGYKSGPLAGEKIEYVWLEDHSGDLREHLPLISQVALRELVRESFPTALYRTEWCRSIFHSLNNLKDYRNALPLHMLVSILVEVNAEAAGEVAVVSENHPTPRGDFLRSKIRDAISDAMLYVDQTVIKQQRDKGRLDSGEADSVLLACRQYLEDLGLTGNTGSIPSYLLALKPEITQEIYQKRYKNILDGMTAKAVRKLRDTLRNDSTIWYGSDYLLDEKS